MFLENEKIRLRALEPNDIDLLYLWENDDRLWCVSDAVAPYSRDVLQQYIDNACKTIYERGEFRFVVELKSNENPRAVGFIDLFDFDALNLRAAVGILIYAEADRRQGFASAALNLLMKYCFGVLQLHQIYCNVGEENTASLKLFANAGFETVGIKKQWQKTPQGWKNEIIMQKINSK